MPARHFLPVNRHFDHAQTEPLSQDENLQVEQVAGFLESREQLATGRGTKHFKSTLSVNRRDPQ